MIRPTSDDIGRRVVYRDEPRHIAEEGTLISFTSDTAFIRFHGYIAACRFPDLFWMEER